MVRQWTFGAAATLLLVAGCVSGSVDTATPPGLVGTKWRLAEFVSSDDSIGTIKPVAGEAYTLELAPDGSVAMQLSCNRGRGSWTSPDSKSERGSLSFGPLASTRAACPPGNLDRLGRDMEHVASFVIEGGRLHLNLKMDSGNYVWAAAD